LIFDSGFAQNPEIRPVPLKIPWGWSCTSIGHGSVNEIATVMLAVEIWASAGKAEIGLAGMLRLRNPTAIQERLYVQDYHPDPTKNFRRLFKSKMLETVSKPVHRQ